MPVSPISASAMERLFEPFFRGDVRDSRQGLGLGLHIASQIAQAHGGRIDVTSTADETRFVFKMPLAGLYRDKSRATTFGPAEGPKRIIARLQGWAGGFQMPHLSPVILIVEDEFLLRLDAAETIEKAGFEVIQAGNADEAIAILEARSDIHVVFTDIQMPGSMDGLKLASFVRDRWPPIKILATSGFVKVGPDDLPAGSEFLAKPYRGPEVVATLPQINRSWLIIWSTSDRRPLSWHRLAASFQSASLTIGELRRLLGFLTPCRNYAGFRGSG